MKLRISKKTLAQFTSDVAQTIRQMSEDYGVKSFTFEIKPQGSSIYHAEGSRYAYCHAGDALRLEMAAEHNLGASGVRHEIGSKVQPPAGTTVIEVWYLSGFGMAVTHITEPALRAAN
jgi:hypothetical protein